MSETGSQDQFDTAEETIEDLDVDDADVQGGLTINPNVRKIQPRPTYVNPGQTR